MPNPPLNICNPLARVGLIPASVKVVGYNSELDDKVAGELRARPRRAFRATAEAAHSRRRP